jgi:hypothetical protein
MKALLFLSLILTVADAKKNKGDTSSDSTEAKTEKLGDVPDDATSKKFATKLVKTNVNNFSPDAEGLRYNTLTFNADNTWKADSVVAVMDEEMECTESGTWTMDPAKSGTVSNMNWTISSTDCPTRQAPQELRVEVTLVDSTSGIHVNFR